jgi:hypothetical protein
LLPKSLFTGSKTFFPRLVGIRQDLFAKKRFNDRSKEFRFGRQTVKKRFLDLEKSPSERCAEMSECHTWVSTKQARLMIISKKKEERKNE